MIEPGSRQWERDAEKQEKHNATLGNCLLVFYVFCIIFALLWATPGGTRYVGYNYYELKGARLEESMESASYVFYGLLLCFAPFFY